MQLITVANMHAVREKDKRDCGYVVSLHVLVSILLDGACVSGGSTGYTVVIKSRVTLMHDKAL